MLSPQQKSKVLVVEDDELVSLQIQIKLEILGYQPSRPPSMVRKRLSSHANYVQTLSLWTSC